MRKLRVYADTSVFGGCFDPEFEVESRKFFDDVREGRFTVVISDVTVEELQPAPEEVRQVLAKLPPEHVELVGAPTKRKHSVRRIWRQGSLGSRLQTMPRTLPRRRRLRSTLWSVGTSNTSSTLRR